MAVLVTGGCGFIGGAVVRRLVQAGQPVLVLDGLRYPASLAQYRFDVDAEQECAQPLLDSASVQTGAGTRAAFSTDVVSVELRATIVEEVPECIGQFEYFDWEKIKVRNDAERSCSIALVRGDVADYALLVRMLRYFRVKRVVHCAGETHVDHSFLGYSHSLPFVQSNVLGVHALLEAVRAVNDASRQAVDSQEPAIDKLLVVSTDEVYGAVGSSGDGACSSGSSNDSSLTNAEPNEAEPRWSTVDDPLRPTNPYAASKAAAEMFAQAYATSLGVPVVITRGTNVFGPGQFPEKVIPKFVARLLLREKLLDRARALDSSVSQPDLAPRIAPFQINSSILQEFVPDGIPLATAALDTADLRACIHGAGTARRSYMFVDDAAEAILDVLNRGVVGSIYNLAGDARDFELSALDVARLIAGLVVESRSAKAGSHSNGQMFTLEDFVVHVPDRVFNDASYAMTSVPPLSLSDSQSLAGVSGSNRTADNGAVPTAIDTTANDGKRQSALAVGHVAMISVGEALRRTVAWYREALDGGTLFGTNGAEAWWSSGGGSVWRALMATHSFQSPRSEI